MSTLQTPEFEEPKILTREYWADRARTVKTNERTRPGAGGAVKDNPSVLEDWEHNLKVKEYKAERNIYNEQVLAWKENRAKCYYLVLSHCPRALEHQLKNSLKWEETESNQDVVAPLKMIRDIIHNKKERKESTMTIVESDVEIFTIQQDSGETLDEYCKVFKAQVDTIDVHGGNAGYHLVVYAIHLAALMEKKSIAKRRMEGDDSTGGGHCF